MSRLIDADELLGKAITERRFVVACKDLVRDYVVIRTVYKDLAEFIASAPTINLDDLRPRGMWIPSESDFDDDDTLFDVEEWCDWQCTACHEDICYEDPMERRWLPKFCPNCGAKMEEEK